MTNIELARELKEKEISLKFGYNMFPTAIGFHGNWDNQIEFAKEHMNQIKTITWDQWDDNSHKPDDPYKTRQ